MKETDTLCVSELTYKVISCVFFIAGVCLLLVRIRYGIDFSDESWYVAEPYIVARGATPYVDLWEQAPGFTVPIAFVYGLYMHFNGTQGIFLFSRILYVVFCSLIVFLSLLLLSRYTRKEIILFGFPLLFVNSGIYCISYNTIGLYYILLCSCLVLVLEKGTNKANMISFIAGVLFARTVMGTPAAAGAVIVCFFILCLRRNVKILLSYICGGLCGVCLCFAWLLYRSKSILSIYNGIHNWISTNLYLAIARGDTFYSNITYIKHAFFPFFIALVLLLAVIIGVHINNKVNYDFILDAIVIVFLFLAIIRFYYTRSILEVIKYTWFLSLINMFKAEDSSQRIFAYISLSYVATYILVSLTNIWGFSDDRLYWLAIPSVLGVASITIKWVSINNNRILGTVCCMCLGSALLNQTYTFVYRDDSIDKLGCRVETGIWKDCITTNERAEIVPKMEEFIRINTDESDHVLFLDWVSFGYLMTDAEPCTPTTLDPMSYTYRTNNPLIMDKYFLQSGNMPSKIIYIDSGRDAKLSIEDDQWLFNQFVNENYKLWKQYSSKDSYKNYSQDYRVKIYIRR